MRMRRQHDSGRDRNGGRPRRWGRFLAAVAVVSMAAAGLQTVPASAAVPSVTRVWGQTAIATASELSRDAFPTGASTVYIATVSGYWDALSGGAAAAKQGGPMLLSEIDTLPQDTRDELTRLRPSTIVIQGGVLALSAQVEAALGAYAPTVVRNAGDTAIGTAVLTSQRAFASGAPSVFVATSESFHDALSGGAAAGLNGAPVLLVDPAAPVDGRVTAEIGRLGASVVHLLGGPLALPDTIAQQLESAGVPVQRIWGETALDTSLAINKAMMSAAQQAYLVTGETYYDGLAAAPAAAHQRGAVVLTNGRCLQPDVKQHVLSLNPGRIVVVGGTLAMSAALDSLAACQPDVHIVGPLEAGNSPDFTLEPGSYRVSWQVPSECSLSLALTNRGYYSHSIAPLKVKAPHPGSGSSFLYLVPGDTYRLSGLGSCTDGSSTFPWTATLQQITPDGGPAIADLTITSPLNNVEWTSETFTVAQGNYAITWQAPKDCGLTLRLVAPLTANWDWLVNVPDGHAGSGSLPSRTLGGNTYAVNGILRCGASFTTGAHWTISLHRNS